MWPFVRAHSRGFQEICYEGFLNKISTVKILQMFDVRTLLAARRASTVELLPPGVQKGVFFVIFRIFWVLLRAADAQLPGVKGQKFTQFGGAKSSQLGKFSVNLPYLLRNPR